MQEDAENNRELSEVTTENLKYEKEMNKSSNTILDLPALVIHDFKPLLEIAHRKLPNLLKC